MPVNEVHKMINAIDNKKNEFDYSLFISKKLRELIKVQEPKYTIDELKRILEKVIKNSNIDKQLVSNLISHNEIDQSEKEINEDERKAFEITKKLADKGNLEAQYKLALLYEKGDGIEYDLEKTFYYYQKAAENGFNMAQNDLAICYENGKGTKKNLEKAFCWYNRAAKNDLETAQYNLGNLYY